MRLINTRTLKIHQFFDTNVPSYAILSHVWGEDELSYQDWLYIQNQNPSRWRGVQHSEEVAELRSSAGYIKITNACQQAGDCHEWIWIDTICIDKTNSAELSEAINTMFKWYSKAEVCYVLLADVEHPTQMSLSEECKWFKRGWTLQELIASCKIEFYSKNWAYIGSKEEMVSLIAKITAIPESCLRDKRYLTTYSAAAKMSWYRERETSRAEDMAYCLLGIFDVRMPLLYGEGAEKAFIRLQEEIMKKSLDHSLLAWKGEPPLDHTNTAEENDDDQVPLLRGSLATHPAQFRDAYSIVTIGGITVTPLLMTSIGIRIRLPILKMDDVHAIAILSCGTFGWSDHPIGIPLYDLRQKLEDGEVFTRAFRQKIYLLDHKEVQPAQVRTIYLLKQDFYEPIEPSDSDLSDDEALEVAIDTLARFSNLSQDFEGYPGVLPLGPFTPRLVG